MKAPWDVDAAPIPTPKVAGVQRTLLDRIDRLRAKHPEVKIAAHFTTASGKWEVSQPDQATEAWDNGFDMIAALEARYGL